MVDGWAELVQIAAPRMGRSETNHSHSIQKSSDWTLYSDVVKHKPELTTF